MKITEIITERYNLDLALTTKQVDDLERFADRLLNKFGINIELSYHFKDRMADDRNRPPIKVSEIQALFKKIAKDKGKKILQQHDHEAVLKDIQSDLNLPMVLTPTYDSLDVKIKTVMRKKDFKSYDNSVVYERKKKKKKKSHYSGRGYYGGLFGDGTSTSDAAAVGECSGYIPKNDKEAKDPRWSMALTNDVRPGEEQRNLKKLGLK